MSAPEFAGQVSSWEEWNPRDYLRDYYTTIEPDEGETIRFLTRTASLITGSPQALEFGCGPTLHHAFPITPHVARLDMADYLQPNLDEIRIWVGKARGRHRWAKFVAYTLQCEGNINPSCDDIRVRKQLTREKITQLMQADAGQVDPLRQEARGRYPVVLSCYCADSATDDKEVWASYMRNIASLTASGGFFITAALREAAYYKVGSRYFPSANITEDDLARVLELDFSPQSINIEVRSVPEHEVQGYKGILLAYATKR